MKRRIATILLLGAALLSAACPKGGGGESTGGILSSDQTEEARLKIIEANVELKKIKEIFNQSEPQLQELQQAIKNKDENKVRTICDELIEKIKTGMEIADGALDKIREAYEMNINDDFKEYLRLKIDCLEKYGEAYKKREEAAVRLRDGYDPKNAAKRELFLAEFKQKDGEFKEIMEAARQSSEDANLLAVEVLNRRK